MKKIKFLFLCLLVLTLCSSLFLASCKNNNNEEGPKEEPVEYTISYVTPDGKAVKSEKLTDVDKASLDFGIVLDGYRFNNSFYAMVDGEVVELTDETLRTLLKNNKELVVVASAEITNASTVINISTNVKDLFNDKLVEEQTDLKLNAYIDYTDVSSFKGPLFNFVLEETTKGEEGVSSSTLALCLAEGVLKLLVNSYGLSIDIDALAQRVIAELATIELPEGIEEYLGEGETLPDFSAITDPSSLLDLLANLPEDAQLALMNILGVIYTDVYPAASEVVKVEEDETSTTVTLNYESLVAVFDAMLGVLESDEKVQLLADNIFALAKMVVDKLVKFGLEVEDFPEELTPEMVADLRADIKEALTDAKEAIEKSELQATLKVQQDGTNPLIDLHLLFKEEQGEEETEVHDMDVTIKVSVEEGAKVEAPESDPANLSDLTETIWSAVQPRIQQLKDLIAKLDFTEDEAEGLPEE